MKCHKCTLEDSWTSCQEHGFDEIGIYLMSIIPGAITEKIVTGTNVRNGQRLAETE